MIKQDRGHQKKAPTSQFVSSSDFYPTVQREIEIPT